MIVVKKKEDLKINIEKIKLKGLKIGFVPTMGALHEGHLSLIRKSVKENDFTVASIFVNPLQFNDKSDLERYPRVPEADKQLLLNNDCDLVWIPEYEDIYADEIVEKYDFKGLDQVMEGKYRPGHFEGVAIVVKRLFDAVTPDRAYFGQKDYQQFTIIKELVKQQSMPIEVIGCATKREQDGLAMSSRNLLLEDLYRKQAPIIYKTLSLINTKMKENTPDQIKTWVSEEIKKSDLKLEYFEISDSLNLQPITSWNNTEEVVCCIAAYAGKIRLIDNIVINLSQNSDNAN